MGQRLLRPSPAIFPGEAPEDQSGLTPCRQIASLCDCSAAIFVKQVTKLVLQYRARLSRNAALRASSGKEKTRKQKDSEAALRRVLSMDATDGRAYVALGKLLLQQKRVEEARKLYDDGAAATGIIRMPIASLSLSLSSCSSSHLIKYGDRPTCVPA